MDKNSMDEHDVAMLLASKMDSEDQALSEISDEHLVALVAGELDETNEKTMLDTIAKSPDSYLRWAGLLKQKEAIEANDTATEHEALPSMEGLKARIFEWLAPIYSPAWIGLSSVCILAIIVLMPATTESEKNRLFDRWQPYLKAAERDIPNQWRGNGASTSAPKPIAQQWFEFGLREGLNKLGKQKEIIGLPKYVLVSEKPSGQAQEDIYLNGEISALIYFMCQSDEGHVFFSEVNELLQKQTSPSPEWGYQAVASSANSTALRLKICNTNKEIITKLILSNVM